MSEVAILGSGIYLPNHTVKSSDLERMLGLEKNFIESRTGIKERRWAADHETAEYMAAEAAFEAVKDAGIDRVDRILVSRDIILTRRAYSIGLPVIEKLAKERVDVKDCFSMDLVNYCPGLVHAIHLAELMVKNNEVQNVLVIASTRYNDIIDTTSTSKQLQFSLNKQFQEPKYNAFLWGCGAGALVVGNSEKKGILGFDARGSRNIRHNSYGIGENESGKGFASLDGRAIYKYAITEVPEFIRDFLKKYELKPTDIDIFIPHQPNPRILEDLSNKIEIPRDRMLVSCDTFGNMIGASVPITYHFGKKSGKIKQGDKVFFCSFGDSYLTTSGLLLEEK